jgi:hypothetical protein
MSARDIRAHVLVLALLALTALALRFAVDTRVADQPGIRLDLPAAAGDWRGARVAFCHAADCEWSGEIAGDLAAERCPRCRATLHAASRIVTEQLPADTTFATAVYRSARGGPLVVQVVLTGRERESIHRPQRCLVAQGFEITRSHVLSVPMPGRARLDVMALDAIQHLRLPGQPTADRPAFFGYWFAGQGRDTPYHNSRMFWLAWDRVFRGVAHRWAYILMQDAAARTAGDFEQDMASFLPAFYPQILRR